MAQQKPQSVRSFLHLRNRGQVRVSYEYLTQLLCDVFEYPVGGCKVSDQLLYYSSARALLLM